MTERSVPIPSHRGEGAAFAGAVGGLVVVAMLVFLGRVSGGPDHPGWAAGLMSDVAVFGGPFAAALFARGLGIDSRRGTWLAAGIVAIASPFVLLSPSAMLLVVPGVLLVAAGTLSPGGGKRSALALTVTLLAAAIAILGSMAFSEAACWYIRDGEWVKGPYGAIPGNYVCSQAFRGWASAAAGVGAWVVCLIALRLSDRREAERRA